MLCKLARITPMDTYANSLMPMYFYVGRVLNSYAMGEARTDALRLGFDLAIKLQFHGARVSSDT